MNWGNGQKSVRGAVRDAWGHGGVTAAAAACAAQIPAAITLSWLLSFDNDDYGVPQGGAFGLACLFVFGPLLFPFVGLVHAAVLTLPAVSLGRTAARWRGGPGWAWNLAALVPLALAWAVLFAALGGPYAGPALWIAVSGVLPALAVAYRQAREARTGRPPRHLRMWLWSVPASVVLLAGTVAFALAATATGLIKEYAPPDLRPDQLVGVWHGEDGGPVELRLGEDGRARAPGCPGTAGWTVDVDTDLKRPSVRIDGPADTADPGTEDAHDSACDGLRSWIIGGTEDDPELFVTSGDPDAPEIERLRRAD
ncbi:hypothetical protein [Streptomyces sp. NPDC052114]|uniref:hypothetical protein n=1 Tax=unclassified Streptomyces TaxID=2593676 RepID=UPI003445BFD7